MSATQHFSSRWGLILATLGMAVGTGNIWRFPRVAASNGGGGLIFGLPSARSLDILHNQDWVWGVGLMLSGLFFAFGAQRFGLKRLRTEVVNAPGCDLHIGKWWSFLLRVVVPLEAVILTATNPTTH